MRDKVTAMEIVFLFEMLMATTRLRKELRTLESAVDEEDWEQRYQTCRLFGLADRELMVFLVVDKTVLPDIHLEEFLSHLHLHLHQRRFQALFFHRCCCSLFPPRYSNFQPVGNHHR